LGEVITLEYDPLLLPTAQHRAGLAGFLVLSETLRDRCIVPLPEIEFTTDERIRVALDQQIISALFEDLYAATEEEQPRPKKLTRGKGDGKQVIPPLREETVEEAGKEKTVYYYNQVVPRAPFLTALQVPIPWIKLWRDAMWTCVRGIPMTRTPYEESSVGKAVGEASKAWINLARFAKLRKKNALFTVDLAGSLYLGSQATNPDRVPFRARADEALLLHFWPVVMSVSVPWALDRDGKRSREGYVLTVPDVSDFKNFLADFRQMAASLSGESEGIYPKEASITLPEEGGLEYLANLAAIAKARSDEEVWSFSVAGADVFHMDKRGNSIPLLYSGHVTADARLLAGYELVRRRYRNVLFRRQLLLNLLRNEPWYRGFGRVFATQPQSFFIGNTGKFFQADVVRKFLSEREIMHG
jgi:CRISPR-associated protein Cmx8